MNSLDNRHLRSDTLGALTEGQALVSAAHPPICIDARMLGADGTGVARYARTLIESLAAVGQHPLLLHADLSAASPVRRWIAATRLSSRATREWANCAVSAANHSIVGKDVFREAQLHFNLYGRLMPITCAGPPGVMHWTYPVPLTMRGWRNTYTIHDVIPLDLERLSPIRPERHRRLLRAIARSADRLLTVSDTARQEIISALGCDPAFVTNTSQAVSVSSDCSPLPEVAEAGDYFLFCGTIEPRKNLSRLAEAYRRSGARRTLVIVGPDGWRAEGVRQMLDHPAIRILPFQPRDRLVRLMSHARALLFPSLSEGFGLPIAEAMTLGTPVMTSAGGATEEIAGGAALLVDPLDITAIAQAIARLDRDPVLCAELRAAGFVRATEFRLKPYGRRVTDVYAELFSPRMAHVVK